MIIQRKDIHCFVDMAAKLMRRTDVQPAYVLCVPRKKGMELILSSGEVHTHPAYVLSYTIADVQDTPVLCRLPWSLIKELGARKSGTVEISVKGTYNQLVWQDAGSAIPQTQRIETRKSADYLKDKLPTRPSKRISYPSTLLFDAMENALKCVLTDHHQRYPALQHICFRGTAILSSDGVQALIQEGFLDLSKRDTLCAPSKIFTSKELRALGSSVKVGVSAHHIYFEIGPARFWLRLGSGTYPSFERFSETTKAYSRLSLSKEDAEFVAEHLDKLPGKDKKDDPVSLELSQGEAPRIRGYDVFGTSDIIAATELRLVNSTFKGREPITAVVRRKHLKTALADFGIRRFEFAPDGVCLVIGEGASIRYIISTCHQPVCNTQARFAEDKVQVYTSATAE